MSTTTCVDTISCTCCADVVPLEEAVQVNGDLICSECADDRTVTCHRCGECIWNEDDCGNDILSLCEHCRDNDYTNCERCGTLIDRDDACYEDDDTDDYPYCQDCHQHISSRPIHRYDYRPEPIFYGRGWHFGVELEVDVGGKDDESAQAVLNMMNAEKELAYIKHDGSLDDGFEIVTHPLTLNYHLTQMPWKPTLELLRQMGYRSHSCGSCGLHVHLGRENLGATVEEQEAAISNILYFFERFWEELLRFSRRSHSQVQRWAARYGYKQSGREILETAKNCYAGRYTCVNLTNYSTIEFRIFRGTLKANTLIATLQLIEEICKVAIHFPEEELKQLSWADFMLRLDSGRTPQLIRYLKERRLYVNEPISVGVEEEL